MWQRRFDSERPIEGGQASERASGLTGEVEDAQGRGADLGVVLPLLAFHPEAQRATCCSLQSGGREKTGIEAQRWSR